MIKLFFVLSVFLINTTVDTLVSFQLLSRDHLITVKLETQKRYCKEVVNYQSKKTE